MAGFQDPKSVVGDYVATQVLIVQDFGVSCLEDGPDLWQLMALVKVVGFLELHQEEKPSFSHVAALQLPRLHFLSRPTPEFLARPC